MKELLSRPIYTNKNTASFPIFKKNFPHGFSWGRNAGNMSSKFDNEIITNKRIAKFLKCTGMSNFREPVYMYPEHKDFIYDIKDENDFENYLKNQKKNIYTFSDCIFTTVFHVPILVFPADCCILIIYAETKTKQQILGIMHAGRIGLDLQLPKKGIRHLITQYQAEIDSIKIGICPSIGMQNYYVDSLDTLQFPVNWRGFYELKEKKVHLNLLQFLLFQLNEVDIKKEQIQSYKMDTYEEQKKGNAYSHRFAIQNKIKNGRFLVAAAL